MPSPALFWRWIDVSIRGGGGGGKVRFFAFFFSIPALPRRPTILCRNRQSPRRGWGTLGMPIYQKHLSKNRQPVWRKYPMEMGHVRIFIIWFMPKSDTRYGIRPMLHPQVVAMPGLKPRKGPPHATKDGSVPRDARRRQSRATGTTESSPWTVAQWNAERISRKKMELQKFL